MSDDRDSGAAVLLSFLIGGLTGAVLALLYAPRSGRETRELWSEKIREGAERGKDIKDRAVSKGRAMVEDAAEYVDKQRSAMSERKERLGAAFEAGRQAYRDEKERGKN
jgi:gas vesicle protein